MRRFALVLLLAAPVVLLLVAVLPTERSVSWFTPDETRFEDCPPSSVECMRQALANVAYREGGAAALMQLAAAASPGSVLDGACHGVVHAIGGAVYARTLEIGVSFREGGSICGYGFYHGVVEQAFSREGIDPAAAARSCGTLATVDERDQCSHGAGHAFGSVGDPAEVASRCEAFADADPRAGRSSCYAGAFMEGFIGALGPPRWGEGAAACTKLEPDIRPTCYGQAAIAEISGIDLDGWADAASTCDPLPGADRIGCIEGWSSQLAGKSAWQERCLLAKEAADVCARTVGEMEAVFRMPDPLRAVDACVNEFKGDLLLTWACAEGVGRRIERPACDRFPSIDAISACRRGYDSIAR
jgi:hypothetical protein